MSDEKAKIEKEKLLAKIREILRIHDNQESNIGANHEYWHLVNKYREK